MQEPLYKYMNTNVFIFYTRGLQNRTNNRGALRGRGRGAAGSRGAGGVTRSYVPGYLRGPGGTHRKMGTEVRALCIYLYI